MIPRAVHVGFVVHTQYEKAADMQKVTIMMIPMLPVNDKEEHNVMKIYNMDQIQRIKDSQNFFSFGLFLLDF